MRIASVGHAVFAAVLIAVGILFLVKGDFGATGEGLAMGSRAHEALGYLHVAVFVACGVGLFWRRIAPHAARVLLVYELLRMLAFNMREIVLAPLSGLSYESWGETAVIVAAAWVLYAWFAGGWDKEHLNFATGDKGVRAARVFFGLAMLCFGQAHFAYLNLTAPLVPAWLSWHVGWAYFFGATYLAAGVAVLVGMYARLAAVLAAVQMGLFTVLVWVPIIANGHANTGQWREFTSSLLFTVAGWVVADSYRAARWSVQRTRGDRQLPDQLAKSRA